MSPLMLLLVPLSFYLNMFAQAQHLIPIVLRTPLMYHDPFLLAYTKTALAEASDLHAQSAQ